MQEVGPAGDEKKREASGAASSAKAASSSAPTAPSVSVSAAKSEALASKRAKGSLVAHSLSIPADHENKYTQEVICSALRSLRAWHLCRTRLREPPAAADIGC